MNHVLPGESSGSLMGQADVPVKLGAEQVGLPVDDETARRLIEQIMLIDWATDVAADLWNTVPQVMRDNPENTVELLKTALLKPDQLAGQADLHRQRLAGMQEALRASLYAQADAIVADRFNGFADDVASLYDTSKTDLRAEDPVSALQELPAADPSYVINRGKRLAGIANACKYIVGFLLSSHEQYEDTEVTVELERIMGRAREAGYYLQNGEPIPEELRQYVMVRRMERRHRKTGETLPPYMRPSTT